MQVYEVIRHFINIKGLKMYQAAQIIGIDSGRFYRIINGDSKMTADELLKSIYKLEINPKYFFENEFLDSKIIEAG